MSYLINPDYVTGYSTYSRASSATYFDKSKTLQTVAADIQRVAWNPTNGEFLGTLVEPTRTNRLFPTNVAAYRFVTEQTIRFGDGFVPAGVPYTVSFYGTGTLELAGRSITLVGAGQWVRTTHTFTPASGTVTFRPAGDVLYAQLEEGSIATSWIPTTSGIATRAEDVVGPAGMFQTSFPASPEPTWSIVGVYPKGFKVQQGLRRYESLLDDNAGNSPVLTSDPSLPTRYWVDIGPVNYFACVDQKVSIASIGPAPLQTLSLKLNSPAEAVALVGVNGTKLHAAILSSSGVITSKSIDIPAGQAVVLYGFPPGVIVSIAVEKASGNIVVGEVIAGTWNELGITQRGHRFSIIDYSGKYVDDFGNTTFVERAFAKRSSYNIEVPTSKYNFVVTLMEAVRARPTVWVATLEPDFSAGAIIYGNYADFGIDIEYVDYNLCAVEIQGLI